MKDYNQIEASFLTEIETESPDIASLLEKLRALIKGGRQETAMSLAELLEDKLVAEGKVDEMLDLLDRMAPILSRSQVEKSLKRLLDLSPEGRAQFKNCGLDGKTPVKECLRRIRVLRTLNSDVLCMDRTWGFGVVHDVDIFYERVYVHFEKKRDHELSLAYAAETLSLLDDTHLLVQKHRDAGKIKQLVQDDPAEIVRLAISSYGPMNVTILQERLSPDLVPETQWKKFWDAARKSLKNDPMVDVPAKRTEAISLRSRAKAFDEHWAEELLKNRNMASLLEHIEELAGNGEDMPDEVGDAVRDRLAFVVKGAGERQPILTARAVMLAARLGIEQHADLDVPAYVESLRQGHKLADVLDVLTARDQKALMQFLVERQKEPTLEALLSQIQSMGSTTLNESIALLLREGYEDRVSSIIRQILQGRKPQVELLYWLCRNMNRLASWGLCRPMELAEMTLLELENDQVGNRLRTQNQLRERFVQRDWLLAALGEVATDSRNNFFLKVKDSPAWPPMEKRSVLGHFIKTFPELETLMVARADAEPKARGPITSTRSYIERQRQLEKIKMVDIPQNSKDIGHARSYGDLRENFEFKAAKETQGLLMRREAELEGMLHKITPTDFEDMPFSQAGIATGIVLQHEDGHQEQYYVLGVWDRDEELGIISCESQLAQAVDGHNAGDRIEIPTEHGPAMCTLVEVKPLPDVIREWIRTEPAPLDRTATA